MAKNPTNVNPFLSKEYKTLLKEIKKKVLLSQLKAAVAVNSELIKLYWEIGNAINQKQKSEGWGSKTTEKLAKDLKTTFPDMKGFSLRNIRYMVAFAKEYLDLSIVQQLVAQIPWGHNMLLLDRVKDLDTRAWYAQKTIENGWSRSVLLHWIDSGLYKRQAKTITNFKATLAPAHSDLAQQTLKDPYCFDFLTLREKFDEKELEQVRLEVGGQDFYADLLFYHLKLRSFVVVELKAKEFSPRDAGQMNFYLTAVDKLLKHPSDNPTIGLLLCKTKNKVVAEYALQDIKKPIGIAEYKTKILESLPKNLKGSLPSIKEIEEELKGEKK